MHGKEDTKRALMKDGHRDSYRGNGLRRLAHGSNNTGFAATRRAFLNRVPIEIDVTTGDIMKSSPEAFSASGVG